MLSFHTPSAEDKRFFANHSWTLAYEYYFSYCIIWEEAIGITLGKSDTALYIHIAQDDCFLLPITDDLPTAMRELERYCTETGTRFRLECVPKEQADVLQSMGYTIEHTRNLDDYVYPSEQLIKLGGRRLQSKRNHISKFERAYTYTIQPLQKERFAECMKMVSEVWLQNKGESQELDQEIGALGRAFDNWDLLHLVGILVCVDHHLAAFTIGEIIDEQLAIVHFEKADTSYNGIYAVVNQLFCSMYFSDVQYVNRQEDVGIPGLRKAKLSYKPTLMVEKYRVTRP